MPDCFPAFFFACDLKNLPAGERLLAAMFQSVTTRTAGFNTIDISDERGIKSGYDTVNVDRWFAGFYSRRNENNYFYGTDSECNCNLSQSGKCRGFWTELEYHVIKNAATIAMLYLHYSLWRCCNQRIRRSSPFGLSV